MNDFLKQFEDAPLAVQLAEEYNQKIDYILDQTLKSSNELKDFLSPSEKNSRRLSKTKEVAKETGMGLFVGATSGGFISSVLYYMGTATGSKNYGKHTIFTGGDVSFKAMAYGAAVIGTVGAVLHAKDSYEENFKSDKQHRANKALNFLDKMSEDIGSISVGNADSIGKTLEVTSKKHIDYHRKEYTENTKDVFLKITEEQELNVSQDFDFIQNAVDMAAKAIAENTVDSDFIQNMEALKIETNLMGNYQTVSTQPLQISS